MIDIVRKNTAILLYQLSRTGIASDDQVKKYLKIGFNELRNLEMNEMVKIKIITVNGRNKRMISLGSKGKKYCRDQFLIELFYHSQANHIAHDIRITEVFYRMKDSEKYSWQMEDELMQIIHRNFPGIVMDPSSCIDARVIIDNKIVGIEVLGQSYTKKLKAKK